MTAPRTAKLAYLTEPAPGVFMLNLQLEDDRISRIEISRDQLGNIIVDGVAMALRENAANRDAETNAAFVGGS